MSSIPKKKLFLTYAWKDNDDGSFDFVVQELERHGLEVVFDRIALSAGKRLWEQIGNTIAKGDIDGWAYLVTRGSLAREACVEEHYLALGRALNTRGGDFPLIAIVKDGGFENLPPSLKIRLGVSLEDRDWAERVTAAVQGRMPAITRPKVDPILVQVHSVPGGIPVVEIRPRIGTVSPYFVGVPKKAATVFDTLEGPPGAPPNGGMLWMSTRGENNDYHVVSARGPLSQTNSVYLFFREGKLPDHLVFRAQGENEIRVGFAA